MGCDFSSINDLQFPNLQGDNLCSLSEVRQISYDKFSIHLDKVRTLCESKNFQEAQKIGDKFFSKHLILEAIEIYQHIIESDPKYGLQQLQGFGNTQMATSYYLQNVWNFYDKQTHKSVYDGLSLCYMILTYSLKEFMSQLSKGQAWYKKMLDSQSNNVGLLIGYGNILCNQNKTNEALQYYEKATQVYEEFVNIHVIKAVTYEYIKSNKQKSIEFSNKILQLTKDNQYAELIIITRIESVDERIAKLQELHKKYPTFNRILSEQGADYIQLKKDYPKARQCYERAIKTNSFYNKAYNNIGICYRNQNDYPNAINHYFKSIQINRLFQSSYSGLAFVFDKMGLKLDQITIQLEKHPKVKKDWFWMKLGEAESTRKPNQIDTAIQFYKKSVEVNPSFYLGYQTLAKAYKIKDLKTQAIQTFKKCIEINPEYITTYFNLGVIYAQEGYEQESIKMYEKAIELNPRYSYAYHNLAIIYICKKDYQKAEQYYENASKYDQKNAIILTNLGICYLDQKKYKDAYAAFNGAKKALQSTREVWGNQKVQFVQKTLKNVEIDNEQKWNIYMKTGSISQDQKNHLQSLMNQFSNKLKMHERINPNIKMPLERVMHPQVMQIAKIIYQHKFMLFGLPKAFKHIISLYCDVDEDYFHIVPLFIVQYFLLNVYERKRGPQDVQKECLQYMKQVAAMVAEKQKEVNQSSTAQYKENQAANVTQKNIKIELTQCKPTNKNINLFKDAAYFNTYEDLYAQIDKVNNAAKPSFNDFALLVEEVRTKAKGIPGGISMKIPSKSEDQFKVIMRIMQKMFKKQITPERVNKTIFNIEARIVNSKYDINLITTQIIDAWNNQVTKILKERKSQNIETECFVSDLIRAKCSFNTVEDLANAVKVADSYCKTHGYQIVQLDNRLNKPQTKDMVLKIQIRDAVCEFQLALPQSAKLFHLDHCVYEIIRSPLGCIFGSYLFISKSVKYPLAKNCEDMFNELQKSKDMMDKINKMYPQYVKNTLTKQWNMLRG